MWTFILLRMHPTALQAPDDQVPVRQDFASLDARELTRQLPGAHRAAYGSSERGLPGRRRRPSCSTRDLHQILRDPSVKESQVLL